MPDFDFGGTVPELADENNAPSDGSVGRRYGLRHYIAGNRYGGWERDTGEETDTGQEKDTGGILT